MENDHRHRQEGQSETKKIATYIPMEMKLFHQDNTIPEALQHPELQSAEYGSDYQTDDDARQQDGDDFHEQKTVDSIHIFWQDI